MAAIVPTMPEVEDRAPGATPEVHTWLALERTLMSWIRTSATLIGLGFTVSKLFDLLHDVRNQARPSHVLGYRTYALVLVGIGVLGLVAAVIQHRSFVRRWWPASSAPPFSVATAVAVMFILLGLAAFVTVLLGY